MPIAIKQAQMKFKDPNTSQYVPVVAAADCSSMINDASTTAISAWSSQKTAAEIGDIDKQVIISSSQPQDATNKLWISSSGGSEVSVPTYAEFTALDAAKVSDVQVNNTSVVTSGVANIPIASASTPGVVKVSSTTYGVQIEDGLLKIYPATKVYIQEGSEARRPIVPSRQHVSVYFGLSKLAGVDLANENVTVGTYPANSKAAIKTMLGVNVDDVQVNGTSVLSNGVANIPVATAETFGVLKTGYSSTGLVKDQSGYLKINRANTGDVKGGTEGYRPIVPINQYAAVFYGLATAAGDTTQKESSNEVGTYTVDAKTAIKTMLGITVDDVQINGTSILSSGVANVPVAASQTLGVVMPDALFGTAVMSSGKIYVNTASNSDIKSATQDYKPVSPLKQHMSTFYGLAKAAGADMASLSSTTVGEYPDAQKIAIQKMLGIYEPPYELVNEFTLDSETGITLTADSNGIPYNFRNVFITVTYPANLVQSTGYGRYKFSDVNGYSVVAETGKYMVSANAQYKHIFLKRECNLTFANYTERTTTGSSARWACKPYGSANGVQNSVGNITKIELVSGDTEPKDTTIKVFAQWAY